MNIPKIAPKTLIVVGSVCGGAVILYLYGKLCYIGGIMAVAVPLLEELHKPQRPTQNRSFSSRYASYH